jgi:hypothetical protein
MGLVSERVKRKGERVFVGVGDGPGVSVGVGVGVKVGVLVGGGNVAVTEGTDVGRRVFVAVAGGVATGRIGVYVGARLAEVGSTSAKVGRTAACASVGVGPATLPPLSSLPNRSVIGFTRSGSITAAMTPAIASRMTSTSKTVTRLNTTPRQDAP